MAFSVVQFLVLLGAAVAVPPSGRYFPEDDVWNRKAVPEYHREPVDAMCSNKIANTLKLAILYTELSETIHPVYTTLHDVYTEPELSDKVTSLLSSARTLQPKYLLDTTYSHRVPMLLWTMSELRPVSMESAPTPRMLETFSRKLADDCTSLFTEQELTTLFNFLTKAEFTFITELKALISTLPTTSHVTTLLMSRIDVVTSTMTWARHLVKAETTIPSKIITYWTETRRPLVEAAGSSWESTETSWESNESWETNQIPNEDTTISVRLPHPTEVRCFRQKLNMYKLLLLNCLVNLDTMALENTLETTLTSPELTITPDTLTFLRRELPLTITKMLRTVHLKLADIFMEPSVSAVLGLTRPKFEVLLNVNVLRSLTSQPTRLGQTLQTVVDAVMASDKLCTVDASLLTHNLTTIIRHLQEHMRVNEIKATLKPVFSRYLTTFTINKLFSGFESRYVPIRNLHTTLVRCLTADLTTVTPRPETLLVRYTFFLPASTVPTLHSTRVPAVTDVLMTSLRRVGVAPTTPLLLVPGPLLREVILDLTTHLTPTSVPCARLAALKLAAAFARTAITKELSYEERFIELLTERSLHSHITNEQLRLIGEEIHKVLLTKIENTFTDTGIMTAEGIFKDILNLEYATFEKPVPEVLTPLLEKMKTLLTTMTCTENVEDLREKTIVAMIHSLKTPLTTHEIVTIVRKTFTTTAQEETELVSVLTRVLPELTGGLLEEVELMKEYVNDLHIKHFPLVFSDCIVRVLTEVSPIPLMHEMTALFPRESPMAIVIQPRARRLTRHITNKLFKSVTTKGVEVPKEELNFITKTVTDKLNKLWYKHTEPTNDSFKPSRFGYDVAERTLAVLGDVTLEEASPSVIRHVISLSMRELEEAHVRPECLNAARVKLMAGVLRVLLERHVLTATPESGLFVTVYNLLRPDVHTLEEIQTVTSVLTTTLRTKVTHAMTGLTMFTDTARTEQLVRELFTLPYKRLTGLTLRELLVEPLSKMKTFYRDFTTTCSFDMNTFTREVDTFSERWSQITLTKTDFTQLLTPVLSDRTLLEKVCTKLETVAFPEIHHHVTTTFLFTKNAITATSPAVFRRFFGRTMVSTFGLTSPAPLRGFLEQPLFDVFTTELYTELLHKLTELKITHQEAEGLLNTAIIRSLEEATPTPTPRTPYLPSGRPFNQF